MRVHIEHVANPVVDNPDGDSLLKKTPYAVLSREEPGRPWFAAVSPLAIDGEGDVIFSAIRTEYVRIPLFSYRARVDNNGYRAACLRLGVRMAEQLGSTRVDTLFIVCADREPNADGVGELLVGFAYRT